MATGSLTIDNLLAVQHQSAAEYGLDTIAEVLQNDLQAWNGIVGDLVGDLCDMTTDRQRIYGASQASGQMNEVDEFGRAPTVQPTPGAEVGFPLRMFQHNIGWSNLWFKTHTPADMARAVMGGQTAHNRRIHREIRRAIFGATNYTFNDYLVDKINLSVKRFVNADSGVIPNGPNGEEFDGATHSHYLANNGWDAAFLTSAINDVVEHGHGAYIKVCINRANETTVKGFTGFTPYEDPRLVLGIADNHAGERLDISRLDNRAIGIFGAGEVWVKSWVPAGYVFIYDAGAPDKPLAYRQRAQTSLQGLRFASSLDAFPLHAQVMEAEFGVGVWTRTNGAAVHFGAGTWADPSL